MLSYMLVVAWKIVRNSITPELSGIEIFYFNHLASTVSLSLTAKPDLQGVSKQLLTEVVHGYAC